jgi:hypothetical protein
MIRIPSIPEIPGNPMSTSATSGAVEPIPASASYIDR